MSVNRSLISDLTLLLNAGRVDPILRDAVLRVEAGVESLQSERDNNHDFHVAAIRQRDHWKERHHASEAALAAAREELSEARVKAQRVPGLEKALSDECSNSYRLAQELADRKRFIEHQGESWKAELDDAEAALAAAREALEWIASELEEYGAVRTVRAGNALSIVREFLAGGGGDPA